MEAGFHAILQAWDYVVSNNQLSPILMSNYVLLIGINEISLRSLLTLSCKIERTDCLIAIADLLWNNDTFCLRPTAEDKVDT